MKRYLSSFFVGGALLLGASHLLAQAQAQAPGTLVFDSIPSPTPGNVVSQGYQCCGTSEIGDEIRLEADTPRRSGYATVLMSSWSLRAGYPLLPDAGYTHPVTLNIYLDAASAEAHQPAKTVTQTFVIPWRPEADPTCPGGTAWRAANLTCYNGFAFPIVFDLRSLNYDLPDQFIYGVAYNTNTWGYQPIGAPGPYESLNVGLNSTPPVTVGTDINPSGVFWNTVHAAWYTDGGLGGSNIFRFDSGWAPYTPAVQFTTFALPTTVASCKNGAWQNLVRADFSAFSNQGACVSYVNTGK
jgi:hypothetical protein